VANIRLADTMPKRRPGKLNNNVHTPILPRKRRGGNTHNSAAVMTARLPSTDFKR
jgi:hypothetical protein